MARDGNIGDTGGTRRTLVTLMAGDWDIGDTDGSRLGHW